MEKCFTLFNAIALLLNFPKNHFFRLDTAFDESNLFQNHKFALN